MPPGLRFDDIDQGDEVHAVVVEAVPARALRALAVAVEIGLAAPSSSMSCSPARWRRRRSFLSVALIEQPYRVAGRRSPAPAHQLDAAWNAVVADLKRRTLKGLPIVCGGRSSGARVACRTAADMGAVGVLCLAFPLHPPGRPAATRQDELDAVTVPVLIVQGVSDPFGMPAPGPTRTVVQIAGNHSLRSDIAALRTAVRDWLVQIR